MTKSAERQESMAPSSLRRSTRLTLTSWNGLGELNGKHPASNEIACMLGARDGRILLRSMLAKAARGPAGRARDDGEREPPTGREADGARGVGVERTC